MKKYLLFIVLILLESSFCFCQKVFYSTFVDEKDTIVPFKIKNVDKSNVLNIKGEWISGYPSNYKAITNYLKISKDSILSGLYSETNENKTNGTRLFLTIFNGTYSISRIKYDSLYLNTIELLDKNGIITGGIYSDSYFIVEVSDGELILSNSDYITRCIDGYYVYSYIIFKKEINNQEINKYLNRKEFSMLAKTISCNLLNYNVDQWFKNNISFPENYSGIVLEGDISFELCIDEEGHIKEILFKKWLDSDINNFVIDKIKQAPKLSLKLISGGSNNSIEKTKSKEEIYKIEKTFTFHLKR